MISGLFRVYYNGQAGWPNVWSVDGGPHTEEHNVSQLSIRPIHGCSGALQSKTQARADNVTTPRAWLEGFGEVHFRYDTAVCLLRDPI